MGTRHLIAVQLDGQYRIAQYGQWDGYPSGQGATVLNFLSQWDRPMFTAKLRAASFVTEEDMRAITARIKQEGLAGRDKDFKEKWQSVWPELSRDTGARILEILQNRDAGIKLRDTIGFAACSLMCEWVYVLDLDADTLEIFRGFNTQPLAESERFAGWAEKYPREAHEGYYPVRLVASYSLDELPSQERLEKDCDPWDDEEDE